MNRLSFLFAIALIANQLTAQVSDTLDLDAVTISSTKATTADPITFQNISAEQISDIYYGQNPTALIERLAPSVVTYGDGGAESW